MVRKLTKLRINEVSSVDRGANEGAKIVLMKCDNSDDNPSYLFNDIMLRKADVDDDVTGDHPGDTDKKLSSRLKDLASAMIIAEPSLTEQTAMFFLLHHPQGRALAREHLKPSISKTEKDTPMTRSEEMQEMRKFVKQGGMSVMAKHIIETDSTSLTEHEYTTLVQEDAILKNISFEKAFQDPTTQLAYKIVRGATHVQALGYRKTSSEPRPVERLRGYGVTHDQMLELHKDAPPLINVKPVSVETNVVSDIDIDDLSPQEAYDNLYAEAEELAKRDGKRTVEQHFAKLFEKDTLLARRANMHSESNPVDTRAESRNKNLYSGGIAPRVQNAR